MKPSALAAVRVLDRPPAPGAIRSVYVHAPFCARRCFYCDFAVKVASADRDVVAESPESGGPGLGEGGRVSLGRYTRYAVRRRGDTFASRRASHGGTPDGNWGGAPAALRPRVDRRGQPGEFYERRGYRLAVRRRQPDQPWDPELSRAVTEVDGTVARSRRSPVGGPRSRRAAGFTNLSVDLIFGLPDHLERDWERDLDHTLSLDPDHVSLYGLSAEPATPLGRAVADRRETLPTEGRYEQEYLLAVDRLAEAGYEAYEVSNFARPGFASRHNSVYWSGEPYVGLGNGAHSYRHPVRRWNLRDWDAYRAGAEGPGLPVDDEEELDAGKVRLERIWLGLRTRRGISLRDLPSSARDRARALGGECSGGGGRECRATDAKGMAGHGSPVELDAELTRQGGVDWLDAELEGVSARKERLNAHTALFELVSRYF